jgi:hypothetical protein
MKKLLLIALALFVPCLLFAQAGISPGGETFATIVVVVIVFFVVRGIMLWYWKIYDILDKQIEQIKEQKITNTLLKEQNEILSKSLLKNTEQNL